MKSKNITKVDSAVYSPVLFHFSTFFEREICGSFCTEKCTIQSKLFYCFRVNPNFGELPVLTLRNCKRIFCFSTDKTQLSTVWKFCVTEFADKHPGGIDVLEQCFVILENSVSEDEAGGDATKEERREEERTKLTS